MCVFAVTPRAFGAPHPASWLVTTCLRSELLVSACGFLRIARTAMQHKLLHETAGQRTFAVVLLTGEEVMASLQKFAAAEKIAAAQLTAIGAFSDLVLQY